MQILGNVTVTFNIKSSNNLQRILEVCREFEGEVSLPPQKQQPIKRAHPAKPKNVSKEETQKQIIDLLKSTFPEGFIMRDAEAVVLEELDRRSHTTKHAIKWAIEKGILIRRGRTYLFTDFVKEQVAAKLQNMSADNTALQLDENGKIAEIVKQPPSSLQVT